MNISADIVAFLKLFGKASVPGLGSFIVEKTSASYHQESKTILPPSQQIIFTDILVQNDEGFVQFVAKRNNLTPEQVETQLKSEIESWKSQLQNTPSIHKEGLGDFYLTETQLCLHGERIESENSDFFGLEEIKLADVQKPSTYRNKYLKKSASGSFNSFLLWTFLVAVPIVGLCVLAYTQQDLLFGKKSFADVSVKNSTHRIEKKDAKPPVVDTLQTDSVKVDTLTPKSPSKNKLYGK